MAVARIPSQPLFHHLLGRSTIASNIASILRKDASESWLTKFILSSSLSTPAISINIPGLFSEIWEGILRAVPKKKTSHMKKRHRQLAGKALKDVTAVNNCPGCGKPKRAHYLCPYCVAEIKESWKQAAKEAMK